MSLSSGARLGPYEILGPIGAGGMGEVYRARDPRIGREIAIKVLPPGFASDPERLRRFEQEVQAAGALNHPNILAIYDVGTHEGSPYIVSELLEGETLRARLAGGAIAQRKAIEYSRHVAQGLAAAHEKGIVHRDLKPENLFITNDGRVKILDFGLAKLVQPESSGSATQAATVEAVTQPGTVLGTVGYMSPEQVRGRPTDHRSDIFSFGVILYEMLTGRRAFQGETAAEAMTAVLKEDPPPLAESNAALAPALERIVRHCLEKNPPERFQSARDLAFGLESLSGTTPSAAMTAAAPARISRRTSVAVAAALVLLVAGYVAGGALHSRTAPPPTYKQLTFRRGAIMNARFAPDGQTIIYGAAWDGKPLQLFSTRPESPESRSLGLPDADILAVSASGEIAISLGRKFEQWWPARGTLARVPLAGGAPREALEDVQEAAWGPGDRLAVIRFAEGKHRLEFPAGKVLYQAPGGLSHLKVSPKGDQVAFLDHPLFPDDTGVVSVVDLAGKKRDLTPRYNSAQGLAWSPSGDEIWFTASEAGINSALRAAPLSGGKPRLIAQVPGRLVLQDIFRDGRVLLTRESMRVGIAGMFPGDSTERDLSWLDLSFGFDLSPDGKTLLISEEGEGGGQPYAVYLRKTDGSPAVKLGDGMPGALSPDGKWALSILRTSPQQLVMLPTGAGESRQVPRGPIENYQYAVWSPDGKRLVLTAAERDRPLRLYMQDLPGGEPRAISPEGYSTVANTISPDGQFVAAQGPENKAAICPMNGDPPRSIPGLEPGYVPVRWHQDGRRIYCSKPAEIPVRVYLVDVVTGRKELWKEIHPADPAGFMPFFFFQVTPDGKSYAYTYARNLADLYLVDGLR